MTRRMGSSRTFSDTDRPLASLSFWCYGTCREQCASKYITQPFWFYGGYHLVCLEECSTICLHTRSPSSACGRSASAFIAAATPTGTTPLFPYPCSFPSQSSLLLSRSSCIVPCSVATFLRHCPVFCRHPPTLFHHAGHPHHGSALPPSSPCHGTPCYHLRSLHRRSRPYRLPGCLCGLAPHHRWRSMVRRRQQWGPRRRRHCHHGGPHGSGESDVAAAHAVAVPACPIAAGGRRRRRQRRRR